MFSHIFLGTNDMEKSRAFYDATLGVLGVKPGSKDPKGRLFYRHAGGTLGLATPIDGKPATAANGATTGFACSSPEQVNQWHQAGLANGGTAIEDPPGERPGSSLYLAYLRDPDGNKLCALHKQG